MPRYRTPRVQAKIEAIGYHGRSAGFPYDEICRGILVAIGMTTANYDGPPRQRAASAALSVALGRIAADVLA
jgi:hypothetical protein